MFKSSIQQESRKTISIGSGTWTICNQDSAFFKSPIIRLYSNKNYFYQLDKCCEFINWTFYRKDLFLQSDSQICNEPASAGVKSKYYQTQITNKNGNTILLIKSREGEEQKFEVIEINKIPLAQNNSTDEIILKRI